MISKEEYLKALDVVYAFHNQVHADVCDAGIVARKLKEGDKIVFETSASKYITLGKAYKVTHVADVEGSLRSFTFKADNGFKRLATYRGNYDRYQWKFAD